MFSCETCRQMESSELGYVVFQAEDGIRYLVRSRGLGDVYKRQALQQQLDRADDAGADDHVARPRPAALLARPVGDPVSYTHLTLPTSDLV